MADRLEYSGEPLPSGLPGFGGETVEVLTLPGFNRVVAAQKFGPVNDAPTISPPNPIPPTGSNPEDPTDEVVVPAPPPSVPGTSNNFCEQCTPPTSDAYGNPLLFGKPIPSSCQDCQQTRPGEITWFDTASNGSDGIFLYNGLSGLRGKIDSSIWKIYTNGDRSFIDLDGATIEFIRAGSPVFTSTNGDEYKAHELEVCVDGQTKTWKVLASVPS